MTDQWTCPHCGDQFVVRTLTDQHIKENHAHDD